MLDREPPTIPFSTEALQANLLRLQNEWETVQASHYRNAIYQYLTAIFGVVVWWAKEDRAVTYARRALHLRGHNSVKEPEPFAALILLSLQVCETAGFWLQATHCLGRYSVF